MFASKPNYLKLRTNLRLCINRLKLLEKKKTELALKARREIADYILAGKDDRARIRVEHIIREDYLVEAMEIVEMLCDLLLARFGLIERMSELDPGIEEAVATLIWVAPRLSGDIQELREVAHQLTIKYGKEFGEMCRRNGFETVNEKVVHKMSLAAPPKILVEHYMVEIARTYKVPFEPDPLVMMGQPPEVSNLIDLGIDALSATTGSRTSAGSNSAHLKAVEAGQVAGGGQLSFPTIPGSIGAGGGGSGHGPGGGGSGGYNAGGGANNGFPGNGGAGGGGGIGGHGPGGGSSGGYNAGGANNGFPGNGGAGGGVGGGGGGYGYCQPGGGNTTSGAGFGFGSSGGTSVGAGGVFGTVGSVSSGNAGYAGQSVAGSTAFGTIGGASSSGGDSKPVHTNIGGGGAAASGIDSFPGGMGSVGGRTGTVGRNAADYSTALIGGVPVLPSEGQFPPPVPDGYLPPSGVHPSSSQPGHPSDSNPVDVPRSGPGNAGRAPMNPQMSWINDDYLPSLPPYDAVVSSPDQYPGVQPFGNDPRQPPFAADGMGSNRLPDIPSFPDVPGLPSVPSNSLGGASVGGDDVDFDDLTRRFEELKKRK